MNPKFSLFTCSRSAGSPNSVSRAVVSGHPAVARGWNTTTWKPWRMAWWHRAFKWGLSPPHEWGMRRRTGGVEVKQPSAFPPDWCSFLPSHLPLPILSPSPASRAQSTATTPPSLSSRLSLVNSTVSPAGPHSRADRVWRWGSPQGQAAGLGLAREPQWRSRYLASAEVLQMSVGSSSVADARPVRQRALSQRRTRLSRNRNREGSKQDRQDRQSHTSGDIFT